MKKLIALLLCAALCLGCFSGCKEIEGLARSVGEELELIEPAGTGTAETTAPPDEPVGTEPAVTNPDSGAPVLPTDLGLTDFDSGLINFLRDRNDGNFTVSPLSFKAALVLAALGAEGETQRQLLDLMGFRTVEEMTAWYAAVLDGTDSFRGWFEAHPDLDSGEAAYEVVNSLWKNLDLPGEFTEDYRTRADELLRAHLGSASGQQLGGAINTWVSEQTRGLIPELVGDVSDASAVLVNALYLKSAWLDAFNRIGSDVFTTAAGDKVDKNYMRQTGYFPYYEDGETQLVSVPLQGGISMVFLLGSGANLSAKLAAARSRRVEVTVPMFDVETALNNRELTEFLISRGCTKMLTEQAEFGGMFTEPLYVGDVIQKAKVHIDEDGLEAAAATAVITYGSTAVPATPLVFRADHEFSFCIVAGETNPELLFWGQIVE